MDLFPTIAHLADVPLPENHTIDGINILPIPEGQQQELNRLLHWRFGNQWAIRKDVWKLIDGKTLYHLGNDPSESTNLSKQHPEIVGELLKHHQAWTREVGNR